MSKTETNEKKEDFFTIGDFFDGFLEDKDCRVFNFSFDGQLTAGNKKRTTRVSIQIPREICDQNLKELDNWCLFGVAIPRKKFVKEEDKEQKGSENNVKSEE